MSPRGFEGVQRAMQNIEARKAAGGGIGPQPTYFKLPNSGDSAIVRFLEQGDEVSWCWTHSIPPRGNQKFGDDVPCRDQEGTGTPCPGCEQGLYKSFKGFINLIWRDGPVYKRNDQGWLEKDGNNRPIVVSRRDTIALWEAGIMVFDELNGLDATYKGLSSRDFKVTRRGEGLNTRYNIVPADPDAGPQPMSDADRELAKTKMDLNELTTPPAYENWGAGGVSSSQTTSETFKPPVTDVNPFLARR